MRTKPSKVKEKLTTFAEDFLFVIQGLGSLLPLPFETPYAHMRRIRNIPYKNYYNTAARLEKQGHIKIIRDNPDRFFVQLTPKGNLKVLLAKTKIQKKPNWDGKWRLIIFDIPEDAKNLRNQFRSLLKRNNFYKLQHSVFIHPYSFNREAIEYLRASGLINYIRILRVDELDDDSFLRKRFKL